MRRTFLLVGILLSILLINPTLAQTTQPTYSEHGGEEEKIGTSFTELFVADKLYVQDKGEWYFVLEGAYAKASDEKEYEASLEVIYGLTDTWQVSAEVPYVWINPDDGDDHNGVGDIELAIGYNFIQERDYAAAVNFKVALPTGDEDRDLGSGQFRYIPQLQGAMRAGPVELYGTVGMEFGDEHDDIFTYSVAAAYPIEKFIPLIELTGEAGNGEDVLYATPGVYWTGIEGMEFGLGVPIGITDDSADYQVILKFVFEL